MNDDFLRTLIDEVVARSLKRIRGVELRPGTVVEGSDASEVFVTVDGDSAAPLEEQAHDGVAVESIIGPLNAGARVLLAFYPPSGCLVVGLIPPVRRQWTSPINAGLTLGDGTIDATYVMVNGMVSAHILITLGATSAVTGDLSLRLPATASAAAHVHGEGTLVETGVQLLPAYVGPLSNTTVRVRALNSAGAFLTTSALAAANPFVWGNTDTIDASITYLAA